MQSWSELRLEVLQHLDQLRAQLPDAVAKGDAFAAIELARDLEGAIMAIGLEEAARLAIGLVPLLGVPTVTAADVGRLLERVRYAVANAPEPMQALPVLGARVLVVDDDAVTRSVLQHILEKAGCEVVQAADLDGARQALRERPLQGVVLDLHLRGGHGTTLCREMRAHPTLRLLPVLLLSGDDDQLALREAYAAGADDFLVKPVRADELVLRLGFLLRGAHLKMAARA